MDRIYSRPRVRLPKVLLNRNNKNLKKIYYFATLWIVVILTMSLTMKAINPIYEALCKEEAERLATEILNVQSTEVLQDVDYNDLIIETKDENGKITMVKSNVILINLLASDIAYQIQEELVKLEKQEIGIAMGALTGNVFFSGRGPDIKLKLVPIGNVITVFVSEFEEAGINQTIHRLYLKVTCEVRILNPYRTVDASIENQMLFAENIIVGEVPTSFYNLEGLQGTDAMEVID